MKSQNKNNKLAFNKASVTELNNNELNSINGGAVSTSSIIFPSSIIIFTRVTSKI